ncbi:hypothetical protein SODALDRAFT_328395 [Sodiomyces alkalinus F11]|uniref:DUF4484 domain-containing protein n=1 Tax=Sodiomyces alkalinus (strain CBS 110278 / VKM F-3762 / F11) TaxID=1314773 RepID=A0A3N2PNA0_SODAK|nr:hypothetical protein SODALDRAFT_328395 [Sodiomyces alkalinus F11]ROT36011.1 hypothetical protein SODALDRAFT_328395 [Sodiomyces alkalinus F11]
MAARRSRSPLSTRRLSIGPSTGPLPDLPPISALFLVDFDVRAGYTISWKRAVPGVDLDGVVEYKCLPSGLHTVPNDLIYFVHEREYAGLSAFVNMPCEEEGSRNARMIAVGILVPLTYGRLGRAWRHARGLDDLATKLAEDRTRVHLLEAYWAKNSARDDTGQDAPQNDMPPESPLVSALAARLQRSHSRSRSASDGTALLPSGQRLSPYHPAWSLTNLLDTFGPLIFPIHRAALLRKRILLSCHAPIHEVCNFVYNISVLANIPSSVIDMLDTTAPSQRLRPLFAIGIHDITSLQEEYAASKRRLSNPEEAIDDDFSTGWVACTTDSILAVKDDLWDMLITMPPPHSSQARDKIWPTIECPRGVPLKATQRDLRRFRTLVDGLNRLPTRSPTSPAASPTSANQTSTPSPKPTVASFSDEAFDKAVEPVSWTELAYSGFLWWASAGEQGRSDAQEEASFDASLLADLAAPPPPPQTAAATTARSPSPSDPRAAFQQQGMADSFSSPRVRRPVPSAPGDDVEEADQAVTELAIIAYFHRLTTQIFTVLGDFVESAGPASPYVDDEEDEGPTRGEAEDMGEETPLRAGALRGRGEEDEEDEEEEDRRPVVHLHGHDLEHMGLDVWSAHDAAFVRELVERYFSREARIEGKGVEVCGVRVC